MAPVGDPQRNDPLRTASERNDSERNDSERNGPERSGTTPDPAGQAPPRAPLGPAADPVTPPDKTDGEGRETMRDRLADLPPDTPEAARSTAEKARRRLWRAAGAALFAVGGLGLFLPLLPTTIFWLLAVVAFLKAGDARAEAILNHPRFGPTIRAYIDHGTVTRKAKIAALTGMTASGVLVALFSSIAPWLVALTMAGLILAAIYVWTRPEPPEQADGPDEPPADAA
jgi:hypothetical protein